MMIGARRSRTSLLPALLAVTVGGPGSADLVRADPEPTAPSAGEAAAIKVAAAYRGILGREPGVDPEPAALADALLSGRPTVSLCQALFGSVEYAQKRSHLSPEMLTESLYLGILERQPDDLGWAQTLEAIAAGQQAARAATMIDSPEFVARFLGGRGPLAEGDAAVVVEAFDSAEVVAFSLPTALECAESYPASVTVRNDGSTTWTAADFRLGAVGDSDPLYPSSRVLLPPGVEVRPNETHSFHFTLTAPYAPTTYVTDWQMVHEAVAWFGGIARSEVEVSCSFAEGVEHVDLILRREGPDWITLEGDPFDYRQAIPCCGTFEDGPSGWPVGIAPAWQLYTSVRGANVLHMRPGPFLAGSESEWSDIGGAYAEVDGKADLLEWNQLFFDTISQWIYEAGLAGQRMEIGLTDWWRARNALEGKVSHPWLPEHNVQDADFLSGLGRDGHYNGVATTWLHKVVSEWGRFGNVIFLDGTEIDLFPQYSADTTWALRAMVREWERGLEYPPHLFGTNGSREAAEGDVDYVTVHGGVPNQTIAGKPTVLNEYNGTPPLSPDSWMLLQCEARASGIDRAYWRGWQPQTRVDMDETFDRWLAMDCSFLKEGCFPPDAHGPGWGDPISRPTQVRRAIDKVKASLAPPCGKNPILTLRRVGLELRKAGYCADQWADAVGVQARDGLWEEWHLVSFGNGCWTGNPYVTAWPYDQPIWRPPNVPPPGEPPRPPTRRVVPH